MNAFKLYLHSFAFGGPVLIGHRFEIIAVLVVSTRGGVVARAQFFLHGLKDVTDNVLTHILGLLAVSLTDLKVLHLKEFLQARR